MIINNNGGAVNFGTGNISAAGSLFVAGYSRIDALRVGTTSTNPGDGNLVVEGDISGSATSTGSFGQAHIGTRASGIQAFSVTGKTKLSLHGNTASDRLLGLEGHASQTGNAVEYFKSGGSAVFTIDKDGAVTAPSLTTSGNVSGSSTSSGSFGAVVAAGYYYGDLTYMTGTLDGGSF